MHDVIVIGGGIAGLSAAFRLASDGRDVAVLEAEAEAGGNVRTFSEQGYRLERGPYSFMASAEHMWRLVAELDFEAQVETAAPEANNRYIYRDGKLRALPGGPASFIATPLLSPGGKLRLMMEPFIRGGARDEDTAWDFFVRRFGREAATYVMGPFVSGIYAGNPRQLGARAAFPKFHNFERDSGSMIRGAFKYMRAKRRRQRQLGETPRTGLFSFRGGLGAITAELARQLGERVITGTPAAEISRTAGGYRVASGGAEYHGRSIICAVPPGAASELLAPLAPEIRTPLTATPMSPVTLVHWSQPAEAGLPAGFGFLMPRIYDLRVLGTVFASQLFEGRAPAGMLTFSSYYGGMLDPEAMELTDSELAELLLTEHSRIFGLELADPPLMKVIRYPGAIPQLLPDHPERIAAAMDGLKAAPGVFLAGNYLTGVGVEHAVESGYNAAGQVQGFLDGEETVTKETA